MIAGKDVNKDLAILEKKREKGNVVLADVLKVGCLITKLLRDIRTNQVLIMKDRGIKILQQTSIKSNTGDKN